LESTKEKLAKEKIEATWNALKPHLARDAIIVVDEQADLVEVGVQIAADNKQFVENCIKDQTIRKPTQEDIELWEQDQMKLFWMLIVQPFVLVQEPIDA